MYENAGCKTLRIQMVVRAASQVKVRIGKCNIEGAPSSHLPSQKKRQSASFNLDAGFPIVHCVYSDEDKWVCGN